MPLLKGSSKKTIGKNIGTLMHEVGKSPHVQSRAQAVAIAFSKAGKSKSKDKGLKRAVLLSRAKKHKKRA